MKNKIAFVLNAVIFILETVGLAVAIGNYGLGIMGYYTQESNLVMWAASLCYLIYAWKRFKNPEATIPYGVGLLKYIATCMVSVTFVVVVVAFIPICWPTMGAGSIYAMLIKGANVYHHFLCPVLSLITFFGFENDLKPGFKETVYAMFPTLLYAIVSTTLNILKVVRGPYPFLYVYEQPWFVSVLWALAIVGGAWGYAAIIKLIKSGHKRKAVD